MKIHATRSLLVLVFSIAAIAFLGCDEGGGACDGKICVRVTNQHEEAGAPAQVQFEKPGSMSVGQLSVPVDVLEFGASTEYFDPSDGAARQCTLFQVVFEARSDSTQAWSATQVYSFSDQPSCFEKGHTYDLVMR
jgi:hypothetical protein